MLLKNVCAFAGALGLVMTFAIAEPGANSTLRSDVGADASMTDAFQEDSWIWSLYGGGAWGDEAGDVYTVRLGIGYHLLDHISFNFEGVVAFADGNPSNVNFGEQTRDAVGAGFDLILRWHMLHVDRFTFYIDGGCGIIVFDKEWPAHGTNLNFTPQVGVGLTYQLNDRLMLMVGSRWYHISNGRIKGKSNNIGYDAGMFYAGLMWPY